MRKLAARNISSSASDPCQATAAAASASASAAIFVVYSPTVVLVFEILSLAGRRPSSRPLDKQRGTQLRQGIKPGVATWLVDGAPFPEVNGR